MNLVNKINEDKELTDLVLMMYEYKILYQREIAKSQNNVTTKQSNHKNTYHHQCYIEIYTNKDLHDVKNELDLYEDKKKQIENRIGLKTLEQQTLFK